MSARSRPPRRRVAVCVDKSRNYGRGVLRGIAEYVETHDRWSLYLHPRASGSYGADWLLDWEGDGVLGFIEDKRLASALRRTRVPVVELFGHRLDLGLPHVGNDEEMIGRLAADHLLERRFRVLAFAGIAGALWSERRQTGFHRQAVAAGVEHRAFICEQDDASALATWEINQARLGLWLRELPKPVGILGASDRLALRVLDACRREGVAVPEHAAVIGVDNDEETCRLAEPPLTSVLDDARTIGWRAAEMLDHWMRTRRRPKIDRVLIPPLGLVTRRSTEVTAVDDPLVARACQLIRAGACTGLTVPALTRTLGISKSLFYQRFKQALGRRPNEELVRTRLARAEQLLRQTKLAAAEIATRCGFKHPEYFAVAFRRELGLTPGAYRRKAAAQE